MHSLVKFDSTANAEAILTELRTCLDVSFEYSPTLSILFKLASHKFKLSEIDSGG